MVMHVCCMYNLYGSSSTKGVCTESVEFVVVWHGICQCDLNSMNICS